MTMSTSQDGVSKVSTNSKTRVLRWLPNKHSQSTLFKVTDLILVGEAYVSLEPLPVFKNRLEFREKVGDVKDWIRDIVAANPPEMSILESLNNALQELTEGVEDGNDLYISIPLFSTPCFTYRRVVTTPVFDMVTSVKYVYGSLHILDSAQGASRLDNNAYLLNRRTARFYINGTLVDKPCDICYNKPENDDFCLYKTAGYICLLTSNLDDEINKSMQLSYRLNRATIRESVFIDEVINGADPEEAFDKVYPEMRDEEIDEEEGMSND